ncbi:ferritin-like domain-containing protein [Amylocarpus encephaloides]|uniref:Ferritin-like domain-containing protein n=1 Tax=Amylocarpus encephaloides TaxID=45428 RepID=A0A9P8C5K1_9HELO|nr:ferritin-like domain-containing protein [Amylocarpus encephaloides]
MRFSTPSVLALATVAAARPSMVKKQATMEVTDADILQYALTLEHLENNFYKQAVSKWDEKAFTDAGFSAMFYNDLKTITHDEEGHVVYLEAGLTAAGASPVQACNYTFPMTDPKSFVAFASVVEGLGVSAYLGAAGLITTKAYLTAAGSILVTEALHQATQRGAIGEVPSANVFGTPLGLNAVYSIASAYISECPSSNAALPVMAYPELAVASGMPSAPGALVDLFPGMMPNGACFATFVSGLDIVPVKPVAVLDGMIQAIVPPMVSGQSYIFLTSDDSGNLTDSNILAGPAIVEVTPNAPTFNLTITK